MALLRTKSARKFSSICLSTLAVALEATTPMSATRVIPIISAEAVAAVRPGLRTVLRSAIRPTVPKAPR